MARQLLDESYDNTYGLNTGPTRCEMSDEEKLMPHSLWAYWVGEYIKCRIKDTFGYTLDEFLERDRAEMKHLCTVAVREDAASIVQLNNLRNKMNGDLP